MLGSRFWIAKSMISFRCWIATASCKTRSAWGGNGLGRVHNGKGRGRRDHDDYIDIQSNHLRRKLIKALCLAARIPALNDEVATFLVAVFTQALEQCVIKTFMPVGDKSHPPNLARLLRERVERPGRSDAEQGDEFAPFHE